METSSPNKRSSADQTLVTRLTELARTNIVGLAATALLLTGCSQNGFTAKQADDPIVTAFATPTATPIPTPTSTPAPTASATPVPSSTPVATPMPSPTPDPYLTCIQQTQNDFDSDKQNLITWYQQNGRRVPLGDAQPQFRRGTNRRAVVLVHGFLASPAYMKDIADGLTNEGYVVFMPLLQGFGANATAANKTGVADWRVSILKAVELAKRCHSDVSIIAHSLGGGLSTDLIANRGLGGISHLVLLAPYYRIANIYLQAILDSVGTFTDSVSIKDFQAILPSGEDAYDILGLARPLTGEAAPFLPIDATQRVLDYQDVFSVTQNAASLATPKTLEVLTEGDELAKASFAQYYAARRFSNITQFIYPAADLIPHSFQTKANNPQWADLYSKISRHLAN